MNLEEGLLCRNIHHIRLMWRLFAEWTESGAFSHGVVVIMRPCIHECDCLALKQDCHLYNDDVICGVIPLEFHEILWMLFCLSSFFSGWRIRCWTHKEEETGRPVLCADVTYCGCLEKDAPHRPQHVLSRRSGAHQLGQDQIFFGTSGRSDYSIWILPCKRSNVDDKLIYFTEGHWWRSEGVSAAQPSFPGQGITPVMLYVLPRNRINGQNTFQKALSTCVVERWTTPPCAGRWPCTKRWQERPKMLTIQWKWSRECRRFLLSCITWKW